MDYNWKAYEREPLHNRFPDWAEGLDYWRGRVEASDPEHGILDLPRRRALPTPRVFISHKREDYDLALDCANWAKSAGFSIWLDILDPTLASATATQNAIVMATIIEVALLNCSHLIAVMTNKTLESTWVPYEYGRVKKRQLVSKKTAAWKTHKLTTGLPDYLHLGETPDSEPEVRTWLAREYRESQRTDKTGVQRRMTLI